MLNTKQIADRTAARYATRNPFEIAQAMGCIVIFCPLSNLRGYCFKYRNKIMIYISEELEEHERKRVCAHELGHIIMHKGYNRFFMDSCTLMRTSRYEIEADRFAADLIYEDSDLQDYLDCDIAVVSACLGLPEDVTTYRLSSVSPEKW